MPKEKSGTNDSCAFFISNFIMYLQFCVSIIYGYTRKNLHKDYKPSPNVVCCDAEGDPAASLELYGSLVYESLFIGLR